MNATRPFGYFLGHNWSGDWSRLLSNSDSTLLILADFLTDKVWRAEKRGPFHVMNKLNFKIVIPKQTETPLVIDTKYVIVTLSHTV